MSLLKKILAVTPTIIMLKQGCPYCDRAIGLLNSKHIDYKSFDCVKDAALNEEITSQEKYYTYPKIFLKGKFIGGYDRLYEMQRRNEL